MMVVLGLGGKQRPSEGVRGSGLPGAIRAVLMRAADRDDPKAALQSQL